MIIETPIIPLESFWVGPNQKIFRGSFPYQEGTLHDEAILFFLACGFFGEDETYVQEIRTLKPATQYVCDDEGFIQQQKTQWSWHFEPRFESMDAAVDRLNEILQAQLRPLKDKAIILGLSGGLDSRCLAAACIQGGFKPVTYSYQFPGGFPENKIGAAIAQRAGWVHHAWEVPKHGLFERIPAMVDSNHCMANFVNPRQIFFLDAIQELGEELLLGHWGDVLFDSYSGAGDLIGLANAALVKPKCLPFAQALARHWGVTKPLQVLLNERFETWLKPLIGLPPPVQYRAIKSLQWAPRWTSVNLRYFAQIAHLRLPFYAQEIFDFVCACPEPLLRNRLLQIEYIKKFAPALAQIPWQACYPYNLSNYTSFRTMRHLPFRILNRLKRIGRPLIERNWELQYLGKGLTNLQTSLANPALLNWVGPAIPQQYLEQFQMRPSQAADVMAMLHVLSEFARRRWPS